MKNSITKTLLLLALITGASVSKTYAQTTNASLEVVGKMFDAFGKGDMENLKKTVADNSVWTYNGPKEIPYTGIYKGKDGAVQFIGNIISNVEVLDFKVDKMIADGATVAVIGFEKQKVKKTGKILEQKWVQIYTVENGLITKMDEYANTAHAQQLFK
ncbi:hypothetical protein AAFH68_17030 [Flavobacterium sp. CGRL1]